MRRVAATAAIAAVSIVAGTAQTPAPARFAVERPVDTAGAGPRRLQIDVPLLSAARPFSGLPVVQTSEGQPRAIAVGGMSDLRLFDATGREVPYLLAYPPRAEPVWTRANILEIPATKKTSGFEADFGESANIDRVRVDGIPAPFLKRVAAEGSGDREHWIVLQAEATLFDLPEERLQQHEISFQPGAYRYVRLTWNDANSGRVTMPSLVRARKVVTLTPAPPLTAPLLVDQRPSEPGISRYRLRLPAARLPIIALELQVTNDRVMRNARVIESRLAGSRAVPEELGRATLRRVVRDGVAAESLQIPIASPSEAQLDIVIDDGSNPPLQLTAIKAVFATLPFVYFEAGDSPIVARYGDPRLNAPRYDLEAARDTIQIDTVAEARWGEPRAITAAANAAPPVLITAGAAVEATSFKFSRTIPSGAAELASLRLDDAALAHSRGPFSWFSDVRIADANSRQVPYIVEQREEPLTLEIALRPATLQAQHPGAQTQHTSVYALALPYPGLPSPRLVLTTNSAVFSRRVTLGVEHAPDRFHRDRWFQVLASADWAHNDEQTAAPPLTIPFQAPPDQTELRLIVDEGDNATLPLGVARVLLPAYRLRFYRDNGAALRLLYGRPELAAPQYDIQMLADKLMGHPAREVNAEPESAGAAATRAPLVSPLMFWGVLGLAVVVLLGLVVRLVSTKS